MIPISQMFKKQILGTETNHDDDLPPPSSTVADIDIDSKTNKSQSFSRYTDADKITEITGIAKDNFSKYCYGQPLDNARDAVHYIGV